MCHKYSFLLTRTGQILDGGGLTESHSEIASLHGVEQDKCNAYEWQPPERWPDAEVLDGLTLDRETFTPKASALKRISAHLTQRYPDVASFEARTLIDERWHEKTVMLGGRELTIICKPHAAPLIQGRFRVSGQLVKAYGNATVEAGDNATVRAGDNATVEACDNATVRAGDNATVKAWGNATVEAWGNATVKAWGNATVMAYGNATVEAYGNAIVEAGGNATVEAYGNAIVEAGDNATVKAYDNATVKVYDNATVWAYGNATVWAYDNATVIYPSGWQRGEASAVLADQAVLIDRRNGGLVISRADVKS